jgi:hypothetical protein
VQSARIFGCADGICALTTHFAASLRVIYAKQGKR